MPSNPGKSQCFGVFQVQKSLCTLRWPGSLCVGYSEPSCSGMLSDPWSSQMNTDQELLLPGVGAMAGISHEREAGRALLGKPWEISDTARSFSHHKWHQLAPRLLWERVVDAGDRHCGMETLCVGWESHSDQGFNKPWHWKKSSMQRDRH